MPSNKKTKQQLENLRETNKHACNGSLPRKVDIIVDKEATEQVGRLRDLIKKSQERATEKLKNAS